MGATTRHKVLGIGPTADWTLYRTFDGKFERLGPDYLHNSYLWVWLRYTVLGLWATEFGAESTGKQMFSREWMAKDEAAPHEGRRDGDEDE